VPIGARRFSQPAGPPMTRSTPPRHGEREGEVLCDRMPRDEDLYGGPRWAPHGLSTLQRRVERGSKRHIARVAGQGCPHLACHVRVPDAGLRIRIAE
jgi:hypothetical protein